jgi:hypothetical protein
MTVKQCGDELRGGEVPRVCKLSWAHKGLHWDSGRNWVGGIEVEPAHGSLFEIIQESGRNESLVLLDGNSLRLPAVSYKPGWGFYWTETRHGIDLRVDVVTKYDLRIMYHANRHQLMKVYIESSNFDPSDMLRFFIQKIIIETERTIMEAAATIDGKPLFEKKNA